MFLRFSRYRFKEGREAEGLEILRSVRGALAAAEGCENAWLAQGQHPATEVVVIALFRDESSLRAFEDRLCSDPAQGADYFAALRLTMQPPEVTQYEVLG